MEHTLIVSLLLAAPIGLGYGYVGWLLTDRARQHEVSGFGYFAMFWFGVAAYGLLEALWIAMSLAGASGLVFAIVLLHLRILAIVLAFGGLVAYLLRIVLPKRASFAAATTFYASLYVLLVYFYTWRRPIGEAASTWGIQLVYANDSGPYWTGIVMLLFLPPLVCAVAYACLVPLLRGGQRYRGALVSMSLMLLFSGLTLGWKAGDWYWWGLTEKLLGLATVTGVLLAFLPPAWARRLWGAEPLIDAWPRAFRQSFDAVRQPVEERARDLI